MDSRRTNFQVGPGDLGRPLSGSKLLDNLGLKHNNKEKREIQNLDLKNREINTQTYEKSKPTQTCEKSTKE